VLEEVDDDLVDKALEVLIAEHWGLDQSGCHDLTEEKPCQDGIFSYLEISKDA